MSIKMTLMLMRLMMMLMFLMAVLVSFLFCAHRVPFR